MTPFENGKFDYWKLTEIMDSNHVSSFTAMGALDPIPYAKGSEERAEYDRGWREAHQIWLKRNAQ